MWNWIIVGVILAISISLAIYFGMKASKSKTSTVLTGTTSQGYRKLENGSFYWRPPTGISGVPSLPSGSAAGVQVTFKTPFSQPPNVFVTSNGPTQNGFPALRVFNINTNGFYCDVMNVTDSAKTSPSAIQDPIPIAYLAIL